MSTAKKITNDEVKSKNVVTKRATINNVEDITKKSVNQSKKVKNNEDKTKETGKSNKGKTKTDKPKKVLERKFICDICDKRFALRHILTAHRRIHTGEKPFKCQDCGKAFTQRGTLIVHRRIHTGEKPFKCEECGKQFDQSSAYKTHKYVHLTERTIKCPLCDKSYKSVHSMNYHKSIKHNPAYQIKPNLTCKICYKTFTRKYRLKLHMNLHLKLFQCQKCSEVFNRKKTLQFHMTCHEIKPGGAYKCKVCKATFNVFKLLFWHKQTHHRANNAFVCNYCECRMAKETLINNHIVKLHLSRLNLQACGGRVNLLAKNALWEYWPRSRKHTATMKQLKRLPCKFCNITFPNVQALEFHSQFHRFDFKFVCAQCGWRFRKQKYLDAHLNKINYIESESESECDNVSNETPANVTKENLAFPSMIPKDMEDNLDEPSRRFCKQKYLDANLNESNYIESECDNVSNEIPANVTKENLAFPSMIPKDMEDNLDEPSTSNVTLEKIQLGKKSSKRVVKKNKTIKKRKMSPIPYEKKNLRERKTKISYQEELSDTEKDIDCDSDQDPNWYSDSSGDSNSNFIHFSSNESKRQGEIQSFETSMGPIASVIKQELITIGSMANGSNQKRKESMANSLSQDPMPSIVKELNEDHRDPMVNELNQDHTDPIVNGLNQDHTDQIVNGLSQTQTSMSLMDNGSNKIKQEENYKFEQKEMLIRMGYKPIHLYLPHVVIKQEKETMVKEELTEN